MIKRNLLLAASAALALGVLTLGFSPNTASAKGGSGGGGGAGGGGVKTVEARVTGYVTAIDYVNKTVQIGASYYGSGLLNVTSSTDISLDNNSCDLDTIQLGQWCEARYDFATRNATKLSVTSVPTS